MSDNPILTSCNEIINSFLPLVDHRLVGFISDDNAGFINARKCAVIDVQNRINDFFPLPINVNTAYLDKIKELQEILSVIKNMD